MRSLPGLALILFTGLAAAGPEEVAAVARVESTLQAQGLSPGDQAPEEFGSWGLEVRGTAEGPQFLETTCTPPMSVSPSFKGKRFTYESYNRGEWGGRLTVREGAGRARALLEENVIALVPSGTDLYVFSGLDHGMDQGGVHVIEEFDSKPHFRSISRLPGTPLAIGEATFPPGGFLVVTRLSLSRIFAGNSLEVLMARHATLHGANSLLAVGRSQVLIGLCGGVAQVKLPWFLRPPDATYEIPEVTYWTRQ